MEGRPARRRLPLPSLPHTAVNDESTRLDCASVRGHYGEPPKYCKRLRRRERPLMTKSRHVGCRIVHTVGQTGQVNGSG